MASFRGILVGAALLAVIGALSAALATRGGGATDPEACSPVGESSWTMDTLRDWVSFSDQLSVIRVVHEAIPPTPTGPEGWAGFIGRTVTVEVERTLWRRPGAPRAPARVRFGDWGWWGEPGHKRPTRVCGVTRLEVGRTYLAPLARIRGRVWVPSDDSRLRLRGDLVVGGVDGGEPSFAHRELAGRRLARAAALVEGTSPYPAAARRPHLDPARRWNEVDSDRYRPGRRARYEPITVAAGVTARSRWVEYARRGRRGGWCVGLATRPLWPGGGPSPSGEGCGGGLSARHPLTLGIFAAAKRGSFAYGRAWKTVAEVEMAVGSQPPVTLPTRPSPKEIGGDERWWAVPLSGSPCEGITVRGRDLHGDLLGSEAVVRASPGCPQPFSPTSTSAR
jgi:hypothetical protein